MRQARQVLSGQRPMAVGQALLMCDAPGCNENPKGSWRSLVLMVQKSGVHQLIWRIYHDLQGNFTSQVVVWDFFHHS